jgi:hypothetical protein
MELQDLFTKDHEAFLHAFVAVAKILCPTAVYYKIEEARSVTDAGSTGGDVVVYGHDVNGTELDVEVRTYDHPTKGKQIVIEYKNGEGGILYSYSYWFYSFNWVGLKKLSNI